MPRYTADPSKGTIGFIKLSKGTYRLDIGEPKSFARKNKKGVESHGVQYPTKIIASEEHPEVIGKPFPIFLYLHSEGGINYSKQVEAAILGVKDDEEFNKLYSGNDWSYNTDDGSAGDGFWLLKGKVVDIECADPELNEETGDLQTKVIKYRTAV